MKRSVQSRMVSVVRPRKSNFTKPTASTSSLSSCDTALSEPDAVYSGQKSVSLPGAINTPPACMPTLRRQALELLGERQQLARFLFRLLALLEPRFHLARHLQRDQLAGLERDQLRQFVGPAVVPFHDAADIAHHGLGGHGAEGHDLRHRVVAVFPAHVVDHPVAAVLAEVHVEVRHGHALRIQETLEQQVVAQRIEIGDAERIGDQRARAGTAPGTDRHAVGLGPVDEVGDDQEVAGKSHLDDGVDLELQPLAVARHVLGARVRVRVKREHAFFQTGDCPVVQEGFERHAVGCREQRQSRLA